MGICTVWILAWRAREIYEPPRVRSTHDDYGDTLTRGERIFKLIGGRNPEGRVGRIFTLGVYVSLHFILGGIWHANAVADITEITATTGEDSAMSSWVPWAKFFGACMNLNFTFIFLPVSHTFIKYIFSISTDQSGCAICLRRVLYLIPLDQALKLHKLMGLVGAVCAVLHTVCHLMNFGLKPELVWDTYGATVWVTGSLLLIIIFMLVPATTPMVKRGQFEIFWFTHYFWVLFVFINFLHGKNTWGPNYWKFFLVPGFIFVFERCYRAWKRSQGVRLWSFTRMHNPDVMSLAFMKEGPLANVPMTGTNQLQPIHKEGQYAFIHCPYVSNFEWHPMTISAAPYEKHITFHIRIQGPGSWTRQVMEHLEVYLPKGSNYEEMWESAGEREGRLIGIDGKKLFCIDGPYSAPTQHLKQYQEVMICASGIGVTPLAATMKSVIHNIWPRASGKAYPGGANFFWVCSYFDIPSFKWFLRTIREACDAYYAYEKNGILKGKHFTFTLCLTSYERAVKGNKLRADDHTSIPEVPRKKLDEETKEYKRARLAEESVDVGFWGKPIVHDKKLVTEKAPFTEADIWRACTRPDEAKTLEFGPLIIKNGRPKWSKEYEMVAQAAKEKKHPEVGVMFCGNPLIGRTLKELCDVYTKKHMQDPASPKFNLHKEVF